MPLTLALSPAGECVFTARTPRIGQERGIYPAGTWGGPCQRVRKIPEPLSLSDIPAD